MLESHYNKFSGLQGTPTWCFSAKFARFLRTRILKNICEQLLLWILDNGSFSLKPWSCHCHNQSSQLLIHEGLAKVFFLTDPDLFTVFQNLFESTENLSFLITSFASRVFSQTCFGQELSIEIIWAHHVISYFENQMIHE